MVTTSIIAEGMNLNIIMSMVDASQ